MRYSEIDEDHREEESSARRQDFFDHLALHFVNS
jgi:hypothetical protein